MAAATPPMFAILSPSRSPNDNPLLGYSTSARRIIASLASRRRTQIRCQQQQQLPAVPREQRWMFEESEINGPDIWNKTWYPKAADHITTEKTWYILDATDKILGRLASTIAIHIRKESCNIYS